jgi:general L-amino acid transport system permease protein
VPPILQWAIFDATWQGGSREACEAVAGACWTFIKVRFGQFMYGFYPPDERWRVNLAFLILLIGAIPLFVSGFRHKVALGAALLFGYPVIAFYLFHGGAFGLEVVPTPRWGGLFLTLVIAGVGIVASLPIGVLLALGRRSDMPVVRMLCVGFIELVRAVPLITVLFMASVMLPLFLPAGVNFDKLLRALVGVALFSSAYMAEVIRGGLQAIPKGQYEAAKALGLSYWRMTGLIVLPQALRIVIPGIVNTFIGLFKDTTLVLIIGLFDLLGIVQAALTDAAWLGFALEGYVFAAFGFWIFCFAMSRYSMHLERRLSTGHKR